MKNKEECISFFEKVSEFIDGELNDEMKKSLLEHLKECPPCERYIDSIKAIKELIKKEGCLNEDIIKLSQECLKKFLSSK